MQPTAAKSPRDVIVIIIISYRSEQMNLSFWELSIFMKLICSNSATYSLILTSACVTSLMLMLLNTSEIWGEIGQVALLISRPNDPDDIPNYVCMSKTKESESPYFEKGAWELVMACSNVFFGIISPFTRSCLTKPRQALLSASTNTG